MSSFNDPNHMNEAFKLAANQLRKRGTALGITIESDKYSKTEKTADEKFKEAREEMVKDKHNISTFRKQNKQNIKRQSGIRTFSIKNPKQKDGKDEKK